MQSFYEAVSYLPPVGSKLPYLIGGGAVRGAINPTLTMEEQVDNFPAILKTKVEEGRLSLDEPYVHQLTVQGRLPDEFKYAAIALLMTSPFQRDWTVPFFEAPWGKVAPLIHDGGNVTTRLNPYWKNVSGRTDFLQRVAILHQPAFQELDQYSAKELNKLSVDTLAAARYEQIEQERFLQEGRFYQRAALALHAKLGTAPGVIPIELKKSLAQRWEDFKKKMDNLLQEYDISGIAKVRWFYANPRIVPGWLEHGRRYEAEWEPIKLELMHLEETRSDNPWVLREVGHLMNQVTNLVDQDIGLRKM